MKDSEKLLGINILQSAIEEIQPGPSPVHGWLRAIREAFGLSRARIADRLGVSIPTVQNYEKREKAETITLASLRRAAAALDCELVVALVPREGRTFQELAEQVSLGATAHGSQPPKSPRRVHSRPDPAPTSSAAAQFNDRLGLWSAQ